MNTFAGRALIVLACAVALLAVGCPAPATVVWCATGGEELSGVELQSDGTSRSWLITATGNAEAFDNASYDSSLYVSLYFDDALLGLDEAYMTLSLARESDPGTSLVSSNTIVEPSDTEETIGNSAGVEVYGVWPEGCDGEGDCATVSYILTLTSSYQPETPIAADLRVTLSISNEDRDEIAPEEAQITVTVEPIEE